MAQCLPNVGAVTLGLSLEYSFQVQRNTLARNAAEGFSQPIGISEYKLSKMMPEELDGMLPTIEEIEAELRGDRSAAAAQMRLGTAAALDGDEFRLLCH